MPQNKWRRKVVTAKPRLLDLFCGAGGVTRGYQDAGFFVVGVDIHSQPRYCGDLFVKADAMTWTDFEGFDLVVASPPCQAYSRCRHLPWNKSKVYPDLLPGIRQRLLAEEDRKSTRL